MQQSILSRSARQRAASTGAAPLSLAAHPVHPLPVDWITWLVRGSLGRRRTLAVSAFGGGCSVQMRMRRGSTAALGAGTAQVKLASPAAMHLQTTHSSCC